MIRGTVLGAAVVGVLALAGEHHAQACGGCFHPPTQTASDINDERMLLSVSTQQTTLYDQIRYAGTPGQFAWVLPIHGTVDVGLSADVLFSSFDTLTATQIQAPPSSCKGPPASCLQPGLFGASSASDGGAALPPGAPGVLVTKQENVGPYETVQLHPTSKEDPTAITKWLTDADFAIPEDVKPILAQYTKDGFDFLAMKLKPNEGVQSMRPVRVTAAGASLSLPLRMAAVGTGATVGITLWVVSDGRYEPQNFPWYRIDDKDLVWDFAVSASNYTTLRVQNAANFGGKGWEVESSITLNQQVITNVISSGGVYYGNGGLGYIPPGQADVDYLAVAPSTEVPEGRTAAEVRSRDIAALFVGMNAPNVRVTRIRSDIAHAAMSTDLTLQASSDQSEIPNLRLVTKGVNEQCPIYKDCNIVGYGSADQAAQANAAAAAGKSDSGCASTAQAPQATGDLALAMLGILGFVAARAARRRK